MSLVDPGRKAPAFALPDQDGKTHRLRDHTGRPLILYFEPKGPYLPKDRELGSTG
jgi:peroxiredoxin Q/BCP